MIIIVIMGTLLGIDHALAPPSGRQARLGHDLQHQLWIFGALVVVGVVCMLGQGRNSDQE